MKHNQVNNNKIVKPLRTKLKGKIVIPSDKSISHRAAMFSALAKGTTKIKNFSKGEDCNSTLKVLEQLGVEINYENEHEVIINSKGLKASKEILYAGNSGTTIRLISGILASHKFNSVITGDESLQKRPMKRVIEPLSLMGADISGNQNKAPLKINGKKLNAINYHSPLASAQVKSCILLAGLFANGVTKVTEPYKSRDHTERMLEYLGANISIENNTVSIESSKLTAKDLTIAGDISSAAFFLCAGAIIPNSEIVVKNIGLNPTRTGIIDVLKQMGADIQISNQELVCNEEVGDVKIKYSNLKGIIIEKDIIPRIIDEIPIIALMATQANGTTIIKDAQDLRYKESDRIKAVYNMLSQMGANIQETDDGFIITGKTDLIGGTIVETHHDHRIAMSAFIAGLICDKPIEIKGFEWVKISFPEFEECIDSLK